MNTQEQINQIFKEAKTDPNIFGLYFNGSRGKGLATEFSDYDVDMVVKDEAKAEYEKKYSNLGNPDIEINIMTLQELKDNAEFGSDSFWNRYSFAHIKVDLDKTGEIQKIIDTKSTIPTDRKESFVNSALDHYINQVYRSVKCFRDGNLKASHLEAAESMEPLLNAIFALEGRIRPYHKYLEWELTNYPLSKLPWDKDQFLDILLKIIQTADIKIQQETLKAVEGVFRTEGFNKVFDDWKEKLPWMENFNYKT